MGYYPPEISLFVAPVTFLLAQKSNQKKAKNPNASPRKPNAPLAGFLGLRTDRLVLRTAP